MNTESKLTAAAGILFGIFLILTAFVCTVPEIAQFDLDIIRKIQALSGDLSAQISIEAGGMLFYIMIFLPLAVLSAFFAAAKMYKTMLCFISIPFVSYFINSVIKIIVNRPRPPLELQVQEHMSSSSYISRHTFVTACLWFVIIYYVLKYCQNKPLKYFLAAAASFWILFEGYSRIRLGVHHPSDVIGALILSGVFVISYVKCTEKYTEN